MVDPPFVEGRSENMFIDVMCLVFRALIMTDM